jgi:hypothetical protein
MEEQQHILDILKQVRNAVQTKNYVKIKHLSNKLVHHSSIHQDADIISVTVIIYSLSKMIEREDFKKEKNWSTFYKNYLDNLNNMIKALESNDHKKFHYEIELNRKLLEQLSGNLRNNMKDVFRRAKINKASMIYEHGISMETTAKILGISIWELAEYAGRSESSNINLGVTMPLNKRLKLAKDIFR